MSWWEAGLSPDDHSLIFDILKTLARDLLYKRESVEEEVIFEVVRDEG